MRMLSTLSHPPGEEETGRACNRLLPATVIVLAFVFGGFCVVTGLIDGRNKRSRAVAANILFWTFLFFLSRLARLPSPSSSN